MTAMGWAAGQPVVSDCDWLGTSVMYLSLYSSYESVDIPSPNHSESMALCGAYPLRVEDTTHMEDAPRVRYSWGSRQVINLTCRSCSRIFHLFKRPESSRAFLFNGKKFPIYSNSMQQS